MPAPGSVAELTTVSVDEFWRDVFPRQQPVVIRGGVRHWSLVASTHDVPNELLARLSQLVGHRSVNVSTSLPDDDGVFAYAGLEHVSRPSELGGVRRFADVVRAIEREQARPTGHCVYAQSVKVRDQMPELLPLLELDLVDGSRLEHGHWRLWVGSGGHHVAAHFDLLQNLHCVLAGSKRFTLFPPEVLPAMYPGPLDEGPHRVTASLVDPRRPDRARFPRYAEAEQRAVQVELAAGDVLFLPAFWWHAVEAFGVNVAANYWWADLERGAYAEARAAFAAALLGIRPLPAHWRAHYRRLLDHFVFGTPYEHLASAHQGFAGAPTPERIAGLRGMVMPLLAPRETDELAARRLVLSARARIAVRADGILAIGAGDDQLELPDHRLEVFLQFRRPATPPEVAARLRDRGVQIDDAELVQRLELDDARFAVALLYGARLLGTNGVAAVELAAVSAWDWTEALGHGRLAAAGLLRRCGERWRLVEEALAFLDERAPLRGELVPGAGSPPAANVALLGRDPEALRAAAARLGSLLVPNARGERDPERFLLEARIRGLVPVVPWDELRPRIEWPARAAIIVADPQRAAELGLSILDRRSP